MPGVCLFWVGLWEPCKLLRVKRVRVYDMGLYCGWLILVRTIDVPCLTGCTGLGWMGSGRRWPCCAGGLCGTGDLFARTVGKGVDCLPVAKPVVRVISWGSAVGRALPIGKGPSHLVVLSEGHDLSFLWSGRLDLKLVRTGNKVPPGPMLEGKCHWQE
jgi:hypothetical protein